MASRQRPFEWGGFDNPQRAPFAACEEGTILRCVLSAFARVFRRVFADFSRFGDVLSHCVEAGARAAAADSAVAAPQHCRSFARLWRAVGHSHSVMRSAVLCCTVCVEWVSG